MNEGNEGRMFDPTRDMKTEQVKRDFKRDVLAHAGKAWPYLNMAHWYRRRGLHNAAGKTYNYYPNARECYDKAVSIQDDSPYCLSCRAIFLATCPDAGFRDGQMALSDARRAMELVKGTARMTISGKRYRHYFQALAAAYAETGDFARAIESQQEALTHAEKNGNTATRQDVERMRARLELYLIRAIELPTLGVS